MIGKKFYIYSQGEKVFDFAREIAKESGDIKRIVLLVKTRQDTDLIGNVFSDVNIDKLFNGYKSSEDDFLIKIETIKTYTGSSANRDIVICCDLDSNDVFRLEDLYGVKAIIALATDEKQIHEWIKTRNAINIETKEQEFIDEPSAIAKIALEELTKGINISTGVRHPADIKKAKITLKVLSEYELEMDAAVLEAYLVNSLGWQTKHSKEIKALFLELKGMKVMKGLVRDDITKIFETWEKTLKKRQQ
ncbi:MAG: hypothetical protein H6Q15_539 [Bacteroidetes bacterium]|nr:hypothetical protein [Bacteroidota bacterium]